MYIRYQNARGTFVMLKLSFLTMAYDAMLPGKFFAPFQVRIATLDMAADALQVQTGAVSVTIH